MRPDAAPVTGVLLGTRWSRRQLTYLVYVRIVNLVRLVSEVN